MKRTKAAARRQELQAMIRDAGLRSTGPRIAVLERLRRVSTPVSHAEIVDDLAPQGFDRATIYRNLIDLTEAGLLSRTDLGDHVWRFEWRRDGADDVSEHPHFVCTDCGLVSCLPEDSVRIVASASAPRWVRREGLEVQLKGRCDRCE